MSYQQSSAAQERDEAYALQASIAVWIEDNRDLVQIAQRLALKAADLGLWDPALHNPFQIVPTDMFEEDGLLAHDLYVNIDHPAWGYYQIKIADANKFLLDSPPPKSPHESQEFSSEAEALAFIEALGASLDPLYDLDEASESEEAERVNLCLSAMLEAYHAAIDPDLAQIKGAIGALAPRVAIQVGDADAQYVHAISHRWDMALFYPNTWVVTSPEAVSAGEAVFLDQAATEELREKIAAFCKREASQAAFLYVAQKILAESGWTVEVVTDSTPEEGDQTGVVGVVQSSPEKYMAFVRPVLHATRVHVLTSKQEQEELWHDNV